MNKICITITICIILFLVIGFTTYKVIEKHNEKLLEVSEKFIIETTEKCLNEEKCSGNMITLQTLYDLNYLEEQANPVTKEFYNPESYVLIEESNYTFVIVR